MPGGFFPPPHFFIPGGFDCRSGKARQQSPFSSLIARFAPPPPPTHCRFYHLASLHHPPPHNSPRNPPPPSSPPATPTTTTTRRCPVSFPSPLATRLHPAFSSPTPITPLGAARLCQSLTHTYTPQHTVLRRPSHPFFFCLLCRPSPPRLFFSSSAAAVWSAPLPTRAVWIDWEAAGGEVSNAFCLRFHTPPSLLFLIDRIQPPGRGRSNTPLSRLFFFLRNNVNSVNRTSPDNSPDL